MLRNKFGGVLYLDLDGVLADFDSHAENLVTASGEDVRSERDWWRILKQDNHFFLNLDPMPYAMAIWKAARSVTHDVQILTALPKENTFPNAMNDKSAWVARHFGKNVKVNFGPYSKDKWRHARPGDILVDDRLSNIQEWKNLAKCPAILHIHHNYKDTIDKIQSLA